MTRKENLFLMLERMSWYKRWINNTTEEIRNKYLSGNKPLHAMISGSFDWTSSSEGFNYWLRAHGEWIALMNKLNIRN